jgi:membrane protein
VRQGIPWWRRDGRWARCWALLRTLVAESNDDRLLGLAAETAFFAVLSIFPGLLIAAGLLGLLDVVVGADLAAGARNQVVGTLDLLLTDEASAAVAGVEDLFRNSSGSLLTFATIGALVTLSSAFAVIIDALNEAYDTSERRSFLRRRLLGLAMSIATMVAVVLALAVLVVGPLFGRGEDLAALVGLGPVFSFAWDVLRFPVLFAGLVVWATGLYHFAPSNRPGWRASLPGALTTAALWIVASLGFHLYLVLLPEGNPVLGAFGGGVIVMIWAYLLSLALLLGGELNATLHRRRQPPTR